MSDISCLDRGHITKKPAESTGSENEEEFLQIPKRKGGSIESKRDKFKNRNLRIDISELSGPSRRNSGSIDVTVKESFDNINDVLKFSRESPHAYSYALLSPNSLALRLNVLKRSLEILKDRPNFLKFINEDKSIGTGNTGYDSDASHDWIMERPPSRITSHPISPQTEKFKIQSNASSAALAALFESKPKRCGSMPISDIYSGKGKLKELKKANENKDSNGKLLTSDLDDIINLLEKDYSDLSKKSEIASSLHDLSLTSADDDQKVKYNILKTRLLYALASPFMESNLPMTSYFDYQHTPSTPRMSPSIPSGLMPTPISLNTYIGRPFHLMSSSKRTLPQSVFTVQSEAPWNVKAANDLAFLVFGVSKKIIETLTLMDIIAPQFRELVSQRISESYAREIMGRKNSTGGKDIIFSGEIIAVMRPADKSYAWTSMWAKRNGGIIICMFEQIPCDAFDVIVSKTRDSSDDYDVVSINEVEGRLATNIKEKGEGLKLADLYPSMSSELEDEDEILDHYISQDVNDAERINSTRYYTLNLGNSENVPCAITSFPSETDSEKSELKLKVHSLPYMAGIFVINASSFQILSCNNSISKNLFGRPLSDLQDKSIESIIPDFRNILQTGIKSQPDNIEVVPGLVLPEHFFRRSDAILRSKKTGENEKDLFLASNSIRGKHKDGREIGIDVQLHVSSPDIYALWVTYSRQTKKNNTAVNRGLRNKKSLAGLMSHPEHRRKSFEGEVTLPSQLKLFERTNADVLEMSSTGEGITRHSSTRQPKFNTFSIPVTRINSIDSSLGHMLNLKESGEQVRTASNPDSFLSREVSHTESPTVSSGTAASTVSSREASRNIDYHEGSHYMKFSEDDILRLEDEMLAQKARSCPYWPKEVGANRRTKKFSDFEIVKVMGGGAYGKVVLVQHKEDKNYTVVTKCIDKERILVDTWVRDRKLGTIPSEIHIMVYLNQEPHPNIIRIIDFYEDSKYYYLETPLFGDPPAIDLFDFIELKKGMTEDECRFIFKQIVSAVYYLHKSGIVHRDIKDENIIVDENGIVKLIDFGSAGHTKSKPFDVFVGTIDYASPEVLRGENYEGKPQDIWALGILLYTILYQENPFYSVDEIMEGDLRIPYVISDKATNLIRKILVRDIDKRPTITDIVEDEWLRI
ncbi:Piso0_002772 [Millerozyma farinosa CBS 7064]|uniref:non-specific serine/threonine protein kinase n=1 Tax=Pichia sorbitophila (strain ATCC MYA-4447 / BCRC 22081 / CBS 7064 / NBRC 10061 / NRRL Y-12695) TaxID=559304 RepID=G8YFX7_PICSO|nr:Piso0_002772 [Millerozyma farinosa CBS 7064]